jgi:hypothetical protein
LFDEWPAFEPFGYVAPYGLESSGLALRLRRCGSARARRLDSYMPPFSGSESLSRTAVTWADGTRRAPIVRARLLRSGRTRSWRVRGAAEAPLEVAHTASFVYVSVFRPSGAVEVLRGRL